MRTNEERLEENISKQLRLRIAIESNTNESEPPTFAGEPQLLLASRNIFSSPHSYLNTYSTLSYQTKKSPKIYS